MFQCGDFGRTSGAPTSPICWLLLRDVLTLQLIGSLSSRLRRELELGYCRLLAGCRGFLLGDLRPTSTVLLPQPLTHSYIDKDFLDFLNAPGSKLQYQQVNLANVERHVDVFTPLTEWDGKESGWTRFDVLFDLTGEMGFDKPELVRHAADKANTSSCRSRTHTKWRTRSRRRATACRLSGGRSRVSACTSHSTR